MEDLEINTTDDFDAAGGERAMSEWARRLLAGAWFALAAAVPVAYLFLNNPFGEGFSSFYNSLILTAGVPMFVAGVCGLGLGADILNREETKNALQAIGRGLLISLLSYLVLFIGLGFVLLPGGGDFIGLIVVGAFFFLYGLLYLGWLVALVGAAAGGLLYFYGRRLVGILTETRNKSSAANNEANVKTTSNAETTASKRQPDKADPPASSEKLINQTEK